jgi:hypothetical protein
MVDNDLLYSTAAAISNEELWQIYRLIYEHIEPERRVAFLLEFVGRDDQEKHLDDCLRALITEIGHMERVGRTHTIFD